MNSKTKTSGKKEAVRPALRIIGDVHGKYGKYIALAHEVENSIQIGDLGFNYSLVEAELDPVCHRVLGGNHDNYEENAAGEFYWQPDHFLGDFGTHSVVGYDFFFLRGGYSIDRECRTEGLDWWPREQITYATGDKALAFYEATKPKFVISHECPVSVIDFVSGGKTWGGAYIRPSMTAQLLNQMWEIHKPETWFFGHHHKNWSDTLNGTTFRCLNELSYIDLPAIEGK